MRIEMTLTPLDNHYPAAYAGNVTARQVRCKDYVSVKEA